MVECKRKRLILYGFLLLFLVVFGSVRVSAFTPVNEKGSAKLPSYKQGEEPWASVPYEYYPGRTIGDGGCGVCSVAMILSGLTGQDITPKDIVDYINEIGMDTYNTVCGEDVPGLAEKLAQKYGVNQELLGLDDAKIKQAIADKKLIWFSTGYNGIYTGQGHYMLCYGSDGDKYYCMESSHYYEVDKEYTYDEVFGGIHSNGAWAFWGGNGYQGETASPTMEQAGSTGVADYFAKTEWELEGMGGAGLKREFDDFNVDLPTKDSLSKDIQQWMETMQEDIIYKNTEKPVVYMRALLAALAIVMCIYAVFLYFAYWLDRLNNFFEFHLLSLLTLGRLDISPDDKTSTFHHSGKDSKTRIVVHKDMVYIVVLLITASMLVLSGAAFSYLQALISFIGHVISNTGSAVGGAL